MGGVSDGRGPGRIESLIFLIGIVGIVVRQGELPGRRSLSREIKDSFVPIIFGNDGKRWSPSLPSMGRVARSAGWGARSVTGRGARKARAVFLSRHSPAHLANAPPDLRCAKPTLPIEGREKSRA